MLKMTKLDGRKILIIPESIKYIESTPDTLIHFLNGESVIVKESLDQILEIDRAFKKSLITAGDSPSKHDK